MTTRDENINKINDVRLSVAPMIDWTDRHCRAFHRTISQNVRLYTEMITAPAILHGPRERLLGYGGQEHPVALQIGGGIPQELGEAVRIAADWGYDEINLNCGCPSDRVQSGYFGAVLMKSPDLVARCLEAMQAASPVEITVKCRIGVDDQTPQEVLPAFLQMVQQTGVRRVIIHARKAWLKGLSPKENREVPPLDYALVDQMKAAFPKLHLSLNGGLASLEAVQAALSRGLDGAMVGRAAYQEPMTILGRADAVLWGQGEPQTAREVAERMRPYIAHHLENGGRLHQVTRHMLGLFHGQPGARGWRRVLSEGATRPGAGLALYQEALNQLEEPLAQQH